LSDLQKAGTTGATSLPPKGSTPTAKPAGSATKGRVTQFFTAGSGGALLGLVVMIIIFSVASDRFLTANNFINILNQITVIAILSLGQTFVIITGGIDLSVGSVMALCVMTLGYAYDLKYMGLDVWTAVPIALLVGALAGLVNGLMVTRLNLPPFIATLAMFTIARGLANIITSGQKINGYPEWYLNLASSTFFGFITPTVFGLVLLYVIAWLWLRYRASGRAVYAIGGNAEVARLSGLNVKRITLTVYVMSGLLAGVAALVLSMRLNASTPDAGVGFELSAIAAVVIGGASLSGGVGTVAGTAIGVLIIGVLQNGLNLLAVTGFTQNIVIGVVIAAAVAIDVNFRNKKIA
jgi:ribose transport system permease protein